MANILTIPNDNDAVMNAERQRLVPWAANHGWTYTGYNDASDHIAQVQRTGKGNPLNILDFVCHGNPVYFDHTHLSIAMGWAHSLSQSAGFSGQTIIYLDACNTGLTSAFGGPIAQAIADGTGCTVYGTKGYMTGTFAEANERCYNTIEGLPPYPNAQNAIGQQVWITFRPRTAVTGPSMLQPNSFSVNADLESASAMVNFLENVLQDETTEFPMLRMAPDATINYQRGNSVRLLDIYANGGLIRERQSGQTWRVRKPETFRELAASYLR